MFTFLSKRYQAPGLGVAVGQSQAGEPGHYTPRGPLVEADNLTTGLKVKREESWLAGVAAGSGGWQGLWGSGTDPGTGQCGSQQPCRGPFLGQG